VELRAYTAGDAQATSVIFLRAVRETASAHYSPEQVEAWAANYGDLDSWAAARAAAHTQLAIIDGHVAGFTDLDDHGYIDMLFVDISAGMGSRRRFSHRWCRPRPTARPTSADHLCQADIPASV
jgi:hypothetical protein